MSARAARLALLAAMVSFSGAVAALEPSVTDESSGYVDESLVQKAHQALIRQVANPETLRLSKLSQAGGDVLCGTYVARVKRGVDTDPLPFAYRRGSDAAVLGPATFTFDGVAVTEEALASAASASEALNRLADLGCLDRSTAARFDAELARWKSGG